MLSPPFGRVVGSDCHCSLRGRDYYESEYNPDGYRKQETMARRYPGRLTVIPARLGSLRGSRGGLGEPPADAAFSRGRFLFGSFVSGRRHGMEVENGASPLKKSGPMLDAERLRRRCQKVAREKKLAPSRRPHPGLRRNVEHLRAALKLAKYGGI